MFPLFFLLLLAPQNGVCAQMHISVTTFDLPAAPGAPNTFIATGNQLASSLLAADAPALMWGVVSANDINAVCQHIISTRSMNFSATVHEAPPSGPNAQTNTVNVQVTAMEGCLAASDASGTEALLATSDGFQAAVICPKEAASKGCAVLFTGDDVNTILSQGSRQTQLATTSRKLLDDCNTGAQRGAIAGGITAVLDTAPCFALGILGFFCAAGMVGTQAWLGSIVGCSVTASNVAHGGCFPGDATVLLPNGEVMHMAGLALGQKVAVLKQGGRVAYEDIYSFGHKDPSGSGHYIQLSLNSTVKSELMSRTLELTPLHFAQVSSGPEWRSSHKRAQDIRVGDMMWAQSSNTEALTSPFVVTGVSALVKQGLYNPFTLSGTIIVNGVAASTHSDWFLDTTFDLLGLTHKLPSAYQTILSPVRTLYYILGKEAYISLYHRLDALISIADFGTSFGGRMMWSLTTLSAYSILAAAMISQLSKSSTS